MSKLTEQNRTTVCLVLCAVIFDLSTALRASLKGESLTRS